MKTKITKLPIDVQRRLAELGLTDAPLWQAIMRGLLARESTTPSDAPFFAGIAQWNGTLRELREALAPLGWRRSNRANFCTVVAPDKRLRIAVSAGDAFTAEDAGSPSTKRRRGERTAKAVSINQLCLFVGLGLEPEAEEDDADDTELVDTWFLLFYTEDSELRAELSLPDSFVDGKINGWRERIILGSVPRDDDRLPAPDFGPDPTFEVRRRA